MRTRCNCYACRNYFDGCEEPRHPEKEMLNAQHNDGAFWWGEPKDGGGHRVRICEGCRKALAEYGD